MAVYSGMHGNMTNAIQTVEQLEELLSEPSEPVVEIMRRLHGDILLLGVAGKIGPSLARMAKRASDLAGIRRRIIGVSRFSDPQFPNCHRRPTLFIWPDSSLARPKMRREPGP